MSQNVWNRLVAAANALRAFTSSWQVIAQSTGDVAAAELAGQAAELRREVEQAFPNARRFIRPGFDEPHR